MCSKSSTASQQQTASSRYRASHDEKKSSTGSSQRVRSHLSLYLGLTHSHEILAQTTKLLISCIKTWQVSSEIKKKTYLEIILCICICICVWMVVNLIETISFNQIDMAWIAFNILKICWIHTKPFLKPIWIRLCKRAKWHPGAAKWPRGQHRHHRQHLVCLENFWRYW